MQRLLVVHIRSARPGEFSGLFASALWRLLAPSITEVINRGGLCPAVSPIVYRRKFIWPNFFLLRMAAA